MTSSPGRPRIGGMVTLPLGPLAQELAVIAEQEGRPRAEIIRNLLRRAVDQAHAEIEGRTCQSCGKGLGPPELSVDLPGDGIE